MNPNLENLDQHTFDRVWKIILELGAQERHFNDLQAGYRNMASIWLLATFSAVGFVISKTISIEIDQELLIAAIAGAGAIGIALLWILDLLVYHRLLDSCFVEGLILERQFPWLPPVRNNMMNTQQGQGVLFRVVGFYLGPIVLLILISGGSLANWIADRNMTYAIAATVLTLLLSGLIGFVIVSKTENTAAIGKRLENSANPGG